MISNQIKNCTNLCFGIILVAFALVISACSDVNSPNGVKASSTLNGVATNGGLVHHASIGGADICEAIGLPTGCDANFSLAANQFADGTVSGQWQDTFRGGGGLGVHVSIDCMVVDGNTAVVGGVVTKGNIFGADISGQRAITALADRGTSNNDDPDLMSFSVAPFEGTCTDLTFQNFINAGFLFELTNGQVKVW